MTLKDAVSTVLNRNAFYRDGYRLLLRVSVVQGIIILLLAGGLISLLLSMDTKHVYFATTSDGRIISIVPLNDPYRSRSEVIAWAAATAQNGHAFRLSRLSPSICNRFRPVSRRPDGKASTRL